MQAVFAIAIVCAGVSAVLGSRTAIALLASTAFTFALCVAEVPFSPPLWMLADVAVITTIIWYWPRVSHADCIILSLFVPSWALYFVDGEVAYAASVVICSAQMILTLPAVRIKRACRWIVDKTGLSQFFDFMIRHA